MTPTIAAAENELVRKRSAHSQVRWVLAVALSCAALTAVAVLPFFVIGEDQKVGCCGGTMPITHDAWMHYNQMNAFWQGLSAGIVYPRWDENTHGYGAPTTSFYPPGIYYLTSAIYFFARDWVKTWAGFYWLTMLASAAAMYWYARHHLSRGASVVAMAAYVFAPYHLLNQYQRGAMSEFTSFIWIPLCLLFAERLLLVERAEACSMECRNRLKPIALSIAGLAASFGAFLWTHPPTAYQFVLVFGACLAVATVRAGNWRGFGWVVLALGLGSMLAAAYFYPAIVEQRLVNYDDVARVWPYHSSYVFDFSQKIYDHVGNPFFVRLDRIWAFNAAAILLSAFVLWRFTRVSKSVAGAWWQWAAAGLLASLLMTKYSEPIGRLIPKIEIGVFSWRMLALTSFAAAMLAGAVSTLKFQISGWWHRAFAALIVIATLAMSACYVVWPMWRGQAFEPKPEHYNYATLPAGAPRDNPPMPPVQLAVGKGTIAVERWTPEFRQLRVQSSEPDQLEFRTRNFAGWAATINGQAAPIHEGAIKNILVDLPAGDTRVTLEFRSTPIRRAGNWVTLVSFALLLSIVAIATWRK